MSYIIMELKANYEKLEDFYQPLFILSRVVYSAICLNLPDVPKVQQMVSICFVFRGFGLDSNHPNYDQSVKDPEEGPAALVEELPKESGFL